MCVCAWCATRARVQTKQNKTQYTHAQIQNKTCTHKCTRKLIQAWNFLNHFRELDAGSNWTALPVCYVYIASYVVSVPKLSQTVTQEFFKKNGYFTTGSSTLIDAYAHVHTRVCTIEPTAGAGKVYHPNMPPDFDNGTRTSISRENVPGALNARVHSPFIAGSTAYACLHNMSADRSWSEPWVGSFGRFACSCLKPFLHHIFIPVCSCGCGGKGWPPGGQASCEGLVCTYVHCH